jgi:GNAT superfamily N-acetyltransferase
MSLIIRPATAADAPTLTEIAHAAKRHWGYPRSWIEAWRHVLTLTPHYIARHRVFVAVEGARAVGFYALEDEGDRWSLGHMWVLPDRIGSGVGRFLFSDAARRAGAIRPGVLRIESDPYAEGFYLRMGAERVGTVAADVEGTQRVLPLLELQVPADGAMAGDSPTVTAPGVWPQPAPAPGR